METIVQSKVKLADKFDRFLYASSSSVYGNNVKSPFSEEHSVNHPINAYGVSKRTDELLAYSYHQQFQLNTIGFRFFTVYGPWSRPDMSANIFIQKILNHKKILLRGNNMMRDFTYIDDITQGIISALFMSLDKTKPIYKIYNLGAGKSVPVISAIKIMSKLLNKTARVTVAKTIGEMITTHANISLAKLELDYSPRFNLTNGLKRYVSWYLNREEKLLPCESNCVSQVAGRRICFPTDWAAVIKMSVALTTKCSIVIYSVATGNDVQRMYNITYKMNSNICNIVFVSYDSPFYASATSLRGDHSILESVRKYDQWLLIPVMGNLHQFSNPRKASRVPKLSPSLFFSKNVQYAIYIDNKIQLIVSPSVLTSYMTSTPINGTITKQADLIVVGALRFKNGLKDNVRTVATLKKLRPNITFDLPEYLQQFDAYKEYSKLYELQYNYCFDGALLVHNLKSTSANRLRCNWYREYQMWSDRDQISGVYTISRMLKSTNLTIIKDAISTWIPTDITRQYSVTTKAKKKYISYVRYMDADKYDLLKKKKLVIYKRFQWNY